MESGGNGMSFQNAKIIGSGISYAEYSRQTAKRGEKDFVMSRGELMDFAACPHKWIAGYQSHDTKSSEWGTLIDFLALNGQDFDKHFAVCPEKYKNEKGETKDWNFNANVCKDWKREQCGKRIIKADVLREANKAVEILFYQFPDMFNDSLEQVMAVAQWRDQATGYLIPVKILLDMVPNNLHPQFGKSLADLKTGQSAAPHDIESAIFNHDYDAQAALYTDVYCAATGEERIEWLLIFQENSEPYEVADPMPMLSQEYIELGRAKYRNALKFYAHCLATNTWPSYSPGHRMNFGATYLVEPKPWMQSAVMEIGFRTSPPEPQPEEAPCGITP